MAPLSNSYSKIRIEGDPLRRIEVKDHPIVFTKRILFQTPDPNPLTSKQEPLKNAPKIN